MAGVILESVSRVYPARWNRPAVEAVRELSLEVRDQELLVFVGPSGCGKTTTLRLIAGLERPDAGCVRIGGRDVTSRPVSERGIGWVPQGTALHPQWSVRRNLSAGLNFRSGSMGKAEIASRVAEAADLLKIESLLDRMPAELSGGESQRVALGRAIVRRPAVMLLDEPLAGLDWPLQAELRSEIRRLQQRLGLTMVYVTHHQTEALAVADRVAVMVGG